VVADLATRIGSRLSATPLLDVVAIADASTWTRDPSVG
jgi:hypothetical protein